VYDHFWIYLRNIKLLFDNNEWTTQTNYSANTKMGPFTVLHNYLICVTYDKKKRTWYNLYKIRKINSLCAFHGINNTSNICTIKKTYQDTLFQFNFNLVICQYVVLISL